MIISHTHRFVYVKTRKTASTSIEIALSKFCGPDDVITPIVETDEKVRRALGYRGPQNYRVTTAAGKSVELVNHSPATLARTLLGEVWGRYVTFTVERNPFDRIISQYYWELPLWQRRGDPVPPIGEYLRTRPVEVLSNWPLYAAEDTVIVDHVGRYESLAADLTAISERIGLPEPIDVSAIRTKDGWRKDRRHYRDILGARDRTLLETVCRREIAAFGYTW